MQIQTHTPLKAYNTFGIDVLAERYCRVTSLDELNKALQEFKGQDPFILGGGSNMLLRSDLSRPVVHLQLKGIRVIKEQGHLVQVQVMAGENWHEFVMWCLDRGYGGLENLSLIPGNVGAAPIQNIGAYGVEMKDCFVSCEAMPIEGGALKTFKARDCHFGYRESVFKSELKGQYVISSVTFQLTTDRHQIHTEYGAIRQVLQQKNIEQPGIKDVSDAVISIRQEKLPDPKEIGNSGSFFKNPVIPSSQFQRLREQFPDIPGYKVSDEEIKVPAGWLIETSGFKGKRMGEYGVHEKQALVLVNYGTASGEAIYQLAKLIQDTIRRLFGIDLVMEVNII